MNLLKNGATATVVYEFGDFRLEPGQHRLSRRDGTPVPLTPRVFDTLLFMVKHHGTVLDKERLMEAVWPDSIVEENNLSQNISTLRRVFGDTPNSHQFIVTVTGRGYRFAAEVETVGAYEKVESKSENSAPSVPPKIKKRDHRTILVATLVLFLGALAFFWSRNARHSAVSALTDFAPADKSIAVLPFENLSSDAENSYFAAGIHDDLLTSLSQIHGLKVISRTSVMSYEKPAGRNMREIGRALGVANVLEGSVRRVDNRVLVSVQLIDARNDLHLWAQRYDRTVADSIGLQGELAAQIAAALKAQLAPEEKANLELKPTDNAEAYALYLQARGRETKEDYIAAEQRYARAIALDPKFALAHARRSIINSWLASSADVKPHREYARAEAEEALRLSPSLGEAHAALGLCLYLGEKDYAAALKELSVAAAILPNEPEVLTYIGGIYRRQGRWRESLATFQRAQELDPRNSHVLGLAANSHLYVRDWAGARAGYNRKLKVSPDSIMARIGLAYVEVCQNGDPAAGRKILQSIPSEIDSGDAAEARWDLSMLERDYASAEKILADFSSKNLPIIGAPKTFFQGRTALARGDVASARRYFAAATPAIEERLRENPDDPDRHGLAALLYAYMQRKEEALREARRAVELAPESQNAFHGSLYSATLALVEALVGEQDQAVTLITRLLTTPGPIQWLGHPQNMTLAELRLRWEWDSLRSNPRFQKILAGPERNPFQRKPDKI